MTPEQFQRVEKLFHAARELPNSERAAYLDQACPDDAEVRAKVEAMLSQVDRDEPLETLKVEVGRVLEPVKGVLEELSLGAQVGPYRVIEQLGEGGMGVVYLAEQTEPVKRQVALKLIKLGMDTKEVVARFESERQALALMKHPNVAAVYDAGATGRGRPYFVMEYVEGVPITQYCDQHKLDTRRRLELFTEVCAAIQHAHQKGVIHRDIKPSNVLVTVENDKPAVKVIDFGVAKATEQRLAEHTVYTEQGKLIGTPEYMSPEQAEGTSPDIDTRTDVYSLGVLLYELLVGALPFDPQSLRQAGYAEIKRIIREVEPPKPSTRLSNLGAESALVSARRQTTLRALRHQIRGDLDWITFKAIEKDRNRRYGAAWELAADLQRHLRHEPVAAGPPSAAYRVRKFARRNRALVSGAAAVLLVSIIGTIVSVAFAIGEAQQRALAEQRATETQQVAGFQATMLRDIDTEKVGRIIGTQYRTQAETTLRRRWVEDTDGRMRKRTEEEIAAFLAQYDAVASFVNMTDVGRNVVGISILSPAVDAIAVEFEDQPQVQAELLGTVGTIHQALGQYDQAELHLRRALDLHCEVYGEGHVEVAASQTNLADCLLAKGAYAEAESLYRNALALRRESLSAEHIDVARSLNSLAGLLLARRDYAAAEPLYREGLKRLRTFLGDDHPDVAASMKNLAGLLRETGAYAEADQLYQEALATYRESLGEEHKHVADTLTGMAGSQSDQGHHQEAELLLRKTLAIYRRLGDEHPAVVTTMLNLAAILQRQGELSQAEMWCREALAVLRETEAQVPLVATCLTNLTGMLYLRGQYAEALPLARKALALRREIWGDRHYVVAASRGVYAHVLLAIGEYADAETQFRRALQIFEAEREKYPDGHLRTADSQFGLGQTLMELGQFSAAEALFCQALGIFETEGKKHPMGSSRVADCHWGLGQVLSGSGQFPEAEQHLLTAQEIIANLPPVQSELRAGRVLEALVYLYTAWDESEPGSGYDAKAVEWRAKLPAAQAAPPPEVAPDTEAQTPD